MHPESEKVSSRDINLGINNAELVMVERFRLTDVLHHQCKTSEHVACSDY